MKGRAKFVRDERNKFVLEVFGFFALRHIVDDMDDTGDVALRVVHATVTYINPHFFAVG